MRPAAVLTCATAALLVVGLIPAGGLAIPTDDPACTDASSTVWFLGVVFDAEQRQDFQSDVDNFEFFLDELRKVHCIPDAHATILAFEDDYERNDKTYEAATESAVRAKLAEYGAEASQVQDPLFFYFHSSHGLVYSNKIDCDGLGTRTTGSFASLGGTSGGAVPIDDALVPPADPNDGLFYDCDLGGLLNSEFPADTRMVVAVDCSFCGGFSDSLTAISGTVPDNSVPNDSGVVRANRVVITGCAQTTECFGSAPSSNGGVLYYHMRQVLKDPNGGDGWTAPGFPIVQGVNAPLFVADARDGQTTASEWFYAAVNSAYVEFDVIGIQEQFRMKYGLPRVADDIGIA